MWGMGRMRCRRGSACAAEGPELRLIYEGCPLGVDVEAALGGRLLPELGACAEKGRR